MALSARSPRTPTTAITIAKGTPNLYGNSGKKTSVHSAAKPPAAMIPPIRPSTVLPGEIAGASLCFPNARPAKYAPESDAKMTIKKKAMLIDFVL